LVNNILYDIEGGHWKGGVGKLRYFGGEGFGFGDMGKVSAYAAIKTDAQLTASSLMLGRYLPTIGFKNGVLAENLFSGIYDKGYIFIGQVQGKSIVFVPSVHV
jgi:hypothetical protein